MARNLSYGNSDDYTLVLSEDSLEDLEEYRRSWRVIILVMGMHWGPKNLGIIRFGIGQGSQRI